MTKKEVAPIVWSVQFISPPSEIVAVDMHSINAAIMDKFPNFFNLGSDFPFSSKDLT